MATRAHTKHLRACSKKRKYGKSAAHAKVQRLNRQGHYLHTYRCPVCFGWHIGHPHGQTMLQMAFERLEKERRQKRDNLN